MGKPSKSSASAGTRKKQTRKAAARNEDSQPQQQQSAKTKGGKKNKKEPRVKMYIPPTRPQPLQRDPIDVLGLGSVLPADLLVVLRRLMKKDVVTKQKALEELQVAWIDEARRPPKSHEDPQGELVETLFTALPVWVRLQSSLPRVQIADGVHSQHGSCYMTWPFIVAPLPGTLLAPVASHSTAECRPPRLPLTGHPLAARNHQVHT